MERSERYILHVDMDAFYASVEQRDNPELRGKPLVVGGGSNRGVVAAASYEARQFGIRSAMPFRDALRRCPDLLHVRPRMAHYKAVSREIFAIFRAYTPLVEGLSLDEAFLDVSESITLFGSAEAIAVAIKQKISEGTGLTASVGAAPNKLVAKIASDLDKPDGLVVITADRVRAVLDPLSVAVIPGIGKKMLARLHAENIRNIVDLRTAGTTTLERLFGKYAERTRSRASGLDDRPVQSSRAAKSVSAEETFDTDILDPADLQRELLRLAERTAAQLRKKQLLAATVNIKVREADFSTCTRQCRLHPPANNTASVYAAARRLLQSWLREHPETPVRLLGVGSSDFSSNQQGDLFGTDTAAERGALDEAADKIRQRFRSLPLGRARTFKRNQIS